MNDSRPVRAAVIGCGCIGRLHVEAIQRSFHARLTCVCDLDRDVAAGLAMATGAKAFASFDDMFRSEPLDLVTVATPDHLHVAPVLAAIASGVHVFCEKPLARTYTEAAGITRAAKERGVKVGVDYNRRFGFGYRKAKELRDTWPAGSLRQAVLQVSDGIPRNVSGQAYALLTSLVSHHLDLLRWLGGDAMSVQAALRGEAPDRPHQAVITLEHVSGLLSCLTATWRAGQQRTVEHLCLMADQMVVSVDDVQKQVDVWTSSPDCVQSFRTDPFHEVNYFQNTILAHVSAFIEAVAAERPVPVGAHDALETLRLIELTIESSRSGQKMPVPEHSKGQ